MIESVLIRARRGTSIPIAVALLRIFIGFAFLPAGLKKVLGEPFTDAHLSGPFHDFLHAFHATGWFYEFVGGVQLVVAAFLMTGRFAFLGAVAALPVLTAILAFCWSTKVYPTASVVTLMWLGTLGLVVWDWALWRGVVRDEPLDEATREALRYEPIDRRLWAWAGIVVLVLYLGVCVATGGVFRPRGDEWSTPAFYVFPLMLFVVLAASIAQARAIAKQGSRSLASKQG